LAITLVLALGNPGELLARGWLQVIDQQFPSTLDPTKPTLAINNDPGSEQMLAQTVTVGMTGTLWAVQFPIGCASGKLIIEIQGVDPTTGEPNGSVMRTKRVPASRLPSVVSTTFTEIKLPGGMRFTAGDRFAIVLRNETGSCGILQGRAGIGGYPGGEAFFDARPNPPGWIPFSDFPAADPTDLPFATVMRVRS
jgi:hypothetical protein